jgi:hypothetical protein
MFGIYSYLRATTPDSCGPRLLGLLTAFVAFVALIPGSPVAEVAGVESIVSKLRACAGMTWKDLPPHKSAAPYATRASSLYSALVQNRRAGARCGTLHLAAKYSTSSGGDDWALLVLV